MMSTDAPEAPSRRPASLGDRYLAEEGHVFLTGVQGLVRVLLDQRRADERAGLRTATLVSGYQLEAAQDELAAIEGVTVLIHDQACGAELRRARKRGKAATPHQQVVINERVCEGCGDCGRASGCLSVEPVETEFGRKTRIHQAHPPLLRSLGLKRKLTFGRWFVPMFRLLRHGRRLRGTPLDPFGYAHVRRVKRALSQEYLTMLEQALERLSPETRTSVVAIVELPDLVRGYEHIKLAGVEQFWTRAKDLLADLHHDERNA
jgi:hypothetical protein